MNLNTTKTHEEMRDPAGRRAGFTRRCSTCQDANGAIRLREHARWFGITSFDVDRAGRWVRGEDEARLLQPVSETPNKGNASNNFQTGLHCARLFLASGSAIRHLRTSGSSRRLIFYLRMSRTVQGATDLPITAVRNPSLSKTGQWVQMSGYSTNR